MTVNRIFARHPVTGAGDRIGVVVNPIIGLKSEDCPQYGFCLCHQLDEDSLRWQSARDVLNVPASQVWSPRGAR